MQELRSRSISSCGWGRRRCGDDERGCIRVGYMAFNVRESGRRPRCQASPWLTTRWRSRAGSRVSVKSEKCDLCVLESSPAAWLARYVGYADGLINQGFDDVNAVTVHETLVAHLPEAAKAAVFAAATTVANSTPLQPRCSQQIEHALWWCSLLIILASPWQCLLANEDDLKVLNDCAL